MYHGKCSLIHSAGSFKTTEKTSDIIKGILKIPSVRVIDIGMRGGGDIEDVFYCL